MKQLFKFSVVALATATLMSCGQTQSTQNSKDTSSQQKVSSQETSSPQTKTDDSNLKVLQAQIGQSPYFSPEQEKFHACYDLLNAKKSRTATEEEQMQDALAHLEDPTRSQWDILGEDGVIFISIDDNEQANLKLLCDDVFGEENFLADVIWQRTYAPISMKKYFSESHEYLLTYAKNIQSFDLNLLPRTEKQNNDYKNPDNDPRGVWKGGNLTVGPAVDKQIYEIIGPTGKSFFPPKGYCWRFTKERFEELRKDNRIWFGADGNNSPLPKLFLTEVQDGVTPMTLWTFQEVGHNQEATRELRETFEEAVFTNPKPLRYMKRILHLGTTKNDIILDFFAGSGSTGHAVMQLNAEDGGNRKFILCQIDEPIKEDKPAYKFCIENNLPPVISSITIERLKRAGEKIAKDIEEENSKVGGLFDEGKKQVPDIGFKVFDSVEAPQLKVDETGQISITENETDALSRIYNMIFTVGLDEPTQVPEEVVKDCIYKIGNHYYITNSEKITSYDYSNAIKNASPDKSGGKVFIDGWTASLNGTLQNYKEDVKIVF